MTSPSTLSSKQLEAFQQFKANVKDVAKPDHTEFDFFRFFKGRAYDAKKAEKMYRNHIEWRKKIDADNLTKQPTPEVLLKYFPGGFFGEDKAGCPIYYELNGWLDLRGMALCVKKQDVIKMRMRMAEYTLETLLPEASKRHGKDIRQMVILFDMEGIGLKSLWKPALDLYNEMLQMAEANYPECLKQCFVVNAPSFFPIAYNICKPFLSEDTKSKIIVMGKNWKKDIRKYIEADQMPVYWGGTATDPDGNPKCQSKICQGGPVPEKYKIQKPDLDLSKFTIQTVGRGSTIQVEALVDTPGMIITWQFWTEGQDIGFGLFRRTTESRQKAGDMDEIIQSERVNSHMIPEDGSLTCDVAGTYVLRFDNTYSWVNSKKIFYTLDILEPSDLQEINAESFVTSL